MSIEWQTIMDILPVVAVLVAIGTLIYAIISGRKQIEKLATQTELLRKQIFGEVYDEAQIKNLQFFLPEKRKFPAMGFEDVQNENEETRLGKEAKVHKGKETDLHVQFLIDAPQRFRFISWGFSDMFDGIPYKDHPTITKYKRAFIVEELSHFVREITKDWHGNWRMEYPFPRFLPRGECFVICFTIIGDTVGKFPLTFEISSEEAPEPFVGTLWVEIVS